MHRNVKMLRDIQCLFNPEHGKGEFYVVFTVQYFLFLVYSSSFPTIHLKELEFLTFKETRNRFQGINSASLCSLAGRYDNLTPTRFLAPIDCLKIPAQELKFSPLSNLNIFLE
jgi:hypothetical protein